MRLRCVAAYRNDPRNVIYRAGDEFDATDEHAAFLLADAPGCFEHVKPKAKRVRKPPQDKAMREPPEEK